MYNKPIKTEPSPRRFFIIEKRESWDQGNKNSHGEKQQMHLLPRMGKILFELDYLEHTAHVFGKNMLMLSISKTKTFLLKKENIEKPLSSALCTDNMAFIFLILLEKIGGKEGLLCNLLFVGIRKSSFLLVQGRFIVVCIALCVARIQGCI